MADPVSWKAIEHGWVVRDADGDEIGHVAQITGDENADIFDGLSIHEGVLTGKKYVPSEHVAQIYEGEVVLDIPRAQVESLEPFIEPPPEEQIIPEASTWYQRLAWRLLTGRKR